MRRNKIFRWMLLVTMLVCAGGLLYARDNDKKPPITMEVALCKEKNVFLIGEPIYIKISFTNNTDSVITTKSGPLSYLSTLKFMKIIGEKRSEIKVLKKAIKHIPLSNEVNLKISKWRRIKPGQTFYTYTNILSAYYIRELDPGKYWFKVTSNTDFMNNDKLVCKKNTLEKEVTFNRKNASADDKIRNLISKFDFWEEKRVVKIKGYYRVAADIIVLFKDSDFYRYAYYWLGHSYLIEEMDEELSNYCFKKQMELFPNSPVTDWAEYYYKLTQADLSKLGKLPEVADIKKMTEEEYLKRGIKTIEMRIKKMALYKQAYEKWYNEYSNRENVNYTILAKIKSSIYKKERDIKPWEEGIKKIEKMLRKVQEEKEE